MVVTDSVDTVGTTGKVEIKPNAVNSVPREAHLGIDVRDVDKDRRDTVVKEIQDEAAAIATRRKVKHTFEIVNQDPPLTCSSEVCAVNTFDMLICCLCESPLAISEPF